MVDLAREAFITNNFDLTAEMYERTIREKGPKCELFLGLANSLARGGQFSKAFDAYTNAYRYGKVTPEKLKHLVAGLIETVKQQDSSSAKNTQARVIGMFSCGVCRGLLADPVTIPCGHTFCRKCFSKDKSDTCETCGTVHYRLQIKKIVSNVVLVNLIEKLFPNECAAGRLKKEGNQYFERRDYQKAIEVYTKAIEIVCDDHLILSNRCHAYANLDRFSEALADAEKVVSLRPDWPKGYFRKGSALCGLGKHEDAIVAFLQCLALDPKVSSAKDQLSKALDKILSALPPDDPKAHVRMQAKNPSVLHRLIQENFNSSLLLSNISSTLSSMMHIVQDTVAAANNFTPEQIPEIFKEVPAPDDPSNMGSSSTTASHSSIQKFRCSSLPDCSIVDHEELQRSVLPRSYSPLPHSVASRKRLRLPSTNQEPQSPTHTSPQKFSKPSTTSFNEESAKDAQEDKGAHCADGCLNTEDLECSLCYRLFYEPVTTPCGHTFCRKCLDRCLDHTVSCPMCKGNIAEYLAERRHAVTESIQTIMETYLMEAYRERCKTNDEEMIELARMGSENQSEVPVFVCTIAFPTMSCPLHVFEPRYRLMIRQCMESGTRQFGMCLQSSGDDDNVFVDYGCMLEIRDVQYFPDGRSVVDTIGGRRFKVLSRGQRDGYNTARVEFIKDAPVMQEDLPGLTALQDEIYRMLQQWLSNLPPAQQNKIFQTHGEMPPVESCLDSLPNGPRWSWWALAVLPYNNMRVQLAILAMVCLKERFSALKKIMEYILRHSSR